MKQLFAVDGLIGCYLLKYKREQNEINWLKLKWKKLKKYIKLFFLCLKLIFYLHSLPTQTKIEALLLCEISARVFWLGCYSMRTVRHFIWFIYLFFFCKIILVHSSARWQALLHFCSKAVIVDAILVDAKPKAKTIYDSRI